MLRYGTDSVRVNLLNRCKQGDAFKSNTKTRGARQSKVCWFTSIAMGLRIKDVPHLGPAEQGPIYKNTPDPGICCHGSGVEFSGYKRGLQQDAGLRSLFTFGLLDTKKTQYALRRITSLRNRIIVTCRGKRLVVTILHSR